LSGRNQIRSYASFQKTIYAFHRFSILAFDATAAEIFHQLKSGHPRREIRLSGLMRSKERNKQLTATVG
jgi:hypothetical protein